MKKLFAIVVVAFLILTGCENTMNTPTSKVEEYLGKYQRLDKGILEELDDVLKNETSMSEEQKKEYRTLLEKQYQNLNYKIKNEDIDGDTATVDVEVEVLDYQTTIDKSKEYYAEHKDEFEKDQTKDDNNDNEKTDNKVEEVAEDVKDKAEDMKDEVEEKIDNISSFIDYKIKELKEVSDKTKYDLTFNLTKEDGTWKISELSESDLKKLHGLY